MSLVLAHLFANPQLLGRLSSKLDVPIEEIECHQFPDAESLIKVNWDCTGKDVVLLTSLNHPNSKCLSLMFAAETLKFLKAKSVLLVTPYLPYMRQDKIFNQGEGVTAQYFAQFISNYFDGLVTVDPHLHRYSSLSEVYTIPSFVANAATKIAEWVSKNIENPILIGPDSESAQWIKATAALQNLPYLVLKKKRTGDKKVEIVFEDNSQWKGHTPVLVDDIISSGYTMFETCKVLGQSFNKKPVIVGIHGIFAGDSYKRLQQVSAQIVTTNCIQHESNQIDISESLIDGLDTLLEKIN